MNNKKFLLFFSVIIIYIFSAQDTFGLELKSKYFDINIHNDIDTYQLLEKLDIKYLLHLDTIPKGTRPGLESILKDSLDTLYLEVSDILDIHMYSFQMRLEILPTKGYLNDVLSKYLDSDINIPSYYFYQKNTIYISFQDLSTGILAHEIAHGIISHYFVVPPPPKVQEILCGYVEYSINKTIDKGE